ncbi:MAG: helicase [Gordonia sp.]|uniref:DEAD/DEAH box helicase n=1 Tax=Gordonia sp. (in: high G+C Gram-positive bacteria) TaxID=84139 RepID=UPI000C6AE380|nr:DEAD/DEAH box helicase [Gordonia sp. (in: high G+C Gram-positive bacteria)]MAU84682.1 helicase [Gordonia sp. (in: high G+C Gram-positive bacteria)]
MTPAEPTFPSLLAEETRNSIIEYLSTTFALSDPQAQQSLRGFLSDSESGIFRGPYLKIRTPYQQVGPGWVSPLEWLPTGFRPFQHQAEAFQRLSTNGKPAQPTIVTTGTGSGKTESFLVPLLDHAQRAVARGESGIKAIILYPMNALVTDQARRLAGYIHGDPKLADVTAGVYIGGEGKRRRSTRHALIDHRDTLRQSPPDILLTNYRMLDLLLLRTADNPLWANATTSLQYLVLDEFHTYDGAQGTDVAMLIRRLGAKIGVAGEGRPLGRVTPVATSATLGGGSRTGDLRAFAETVFGTAFDQHSLVTETSLSATDVVRDVDFTLEIPTVDDILQTPIPVSSEPGSWVPLAKTILASQGTNGDPAEYDFRDPVVIGDGLRRHFLTRVAIDVLDGSPIPVAEAVSAIAQAGILPWGVHNSAHPEQVQAALLRFLALVSVAKVRDQYGRSRPLVNVQVQMWVREVSRLMRAAAPAPEFHWWHDGPTEGPRLLPAAYCRVCGRAGWMAATTELGDSLSGEATTVWRNSARANQRSKTRALLAADDAEDGVRYLDPETLEIHPKPSNDTLAVHVSASDEDAANEICPSCGARNAIRYMGSSVATLLSVGLTTEFGSSVIADDEKKTLVFTDSVQDAAHRAAFIEGRAFAFNFRSAVFRSVGDGPTNLVEVSRQLADESSTDDLYAITPPDFVRRLAVDADWLDHDPGGRLRLLLAKRLAFQTQLEAGLGSRTGRTLELTSAVAIDIDADLPEFAARSREAHQNLPQLSLASALPTARYEIWLLGLLDHLRVNGGILHPWLSTYVTEESKRWSIWGGSPNGMPKFPRGRPAPSFYTTGVAGDGDFQSLNPKGESWLTDWTKRCLEVSSGEARALLTDVVDQLAGTDGPLERRAGERGSRIYGLRPDFVVLDTTGIGRLECPVCHHVQPTSAARMTIWQDAPCPRMRCGGRLESVSIEPTNFYRDMYRSGRIRRIVSAEHTGLLGRDEREEVEARFTVGGSAGDPNILACTPTLELGIDIGDLSTVTLASLPRSTANYLQRVGRAGRSTGNAFVLAAVPTSPRDLYFFSEPQHLLAGEVLPPGAYLDATELLQRQYFAFCLDRVAAGALALPQPMPTRLAECLEAGMDDGQWLRSLVDACLAAADELLQQFLDLFGDRIGDESRVGLREFAHGGLRHLVATTALRWAQESDEIRSRRNDLAATIATIDQHGHLDEKEKEDRKRCAGEFKALSDQLYERGKMETLTGLSGVGLLPNYNLLDDSTTLDVHLWWTTGTTPGGKLQTEVLDLSYQRGSSTALTELAPGAFFYAGGKRVEIDAMDIGPSTRPHWRPTRLCPDCGWGTTESASVPACPRCHSGAVSDSGAVHDVLELRKVSAVHRLDDVLIDEDAEDRTRSFFGTITGVDIEPDAITKAWRLRDKAFGAEYARSALVRTINTGLGDAPGEELTVAGETRTAPGFTTCGHCGVVARRSSATHDVRHRGYCATRRGAEQKWSRLLLSHELETQAVRLLLPVSLLHFETTLTSFKGALLLGLRKDFGGDPQHLSVVASSMTDSAGGIRRFLVLHDTVPGGTGYLDRFGEPERLRHILTLARDALSQCPCRTEERAACHRCLYGVLSPREMPNASRDSALRLLEEFLAEWDVETIDTVTGVDIGSVQLSELEIRFREALKLHLEQRDGASYEVALGTKGEELDIRMSGADGDIRRWRMRPLVQLAESGVATEPDFLLTRVDAQTADVAIYLDGKQFHASAEHNRTADDAKKRDALRRADKRVWSIGWDDVAAFESTSAKIQTTELLHQHVKNTAAETVSDTRIRFMWDNPITFLVEYLAEPDAAVWGHGAAATVLAMVPQSNRHGDGSPIHTSSSDLGRTLTGLAEGMSTADASGHVMVVPRAGWSGLPLWICADPNEFESTLGVLTVLDDSEGEVGGAVHDARWRDWLRWSNILQFVASPQYGMVMPRRMAAIWTIRSLGEFIAQPVPLEGVGTGRTDIEFAMTPEWELVQKYTDPVVAELVTALARKDVAVPEPGLEVGPVDSVWQVELAWEDDQVAVVVDTDVERDNWLREHGWTVRTVDRDSDIDAAVGDIAARVTGGTR